MNIFKKNKTDDKMLERKDRNYSNPMETFRKRMNNIFDDFFDDWEFNLPTENDMLNSVGFTPSLDIKEDENALYIEAELPGLKENEIDIEIKDNILTISGEKKLEKEEKNKKYHRVERSYGYFSRSVPIDNNIEEDNIKANYKNGLLNIEIPKDKKSQKTKTIKIDVK